MNITIKATQVDLTPALKQYVEDKIGALEHYRSDIMIARVELERQPRHHSGEVFRAEVNLDCPGTQFRAEETAQDMYAAIDLALPKLVAQIEKLKGKQEARTRAAGRRIKSSL